MIRLKSIFHVIGLCGLALFSTGSQAQSQLSSSFWSSGLSDQQDVPSGGLYALYAENRRKKIPNYITEDLLLQAYSMQRAKTLVTLEKQRLLPALEQTLNALQELLRARDTAYSADNRAYVQVLQALLARDEARDPERLSDSARVRAEIALVRAAAGPALSPLWAYRIDYSKFKVQGYYSDDPDLRRYFIASRYANSVLFPVVPSAATGVDAVRANFFAHQALEMSRLLQHPSVTPSYAQLSGSLDWQFGEADDLTADDVLAAVEAAAKEVLEKQGLAAALRFYAETHNRVPSILSLPLQADQLEAGLSARQALIGWRLLPARRGVDAQAMQHLVYDDKKSLRWPCTACDQPALASAFNGAWHKGYPSVLELMVANGSAHAAALLQPLALADYTGYSQQFETVAEMYRNSSEQLGLPGLQLSVLQAALRLDEKPQSLHSGAGFWVWQRYLGVLYQKASSTPFSKGLTLEVDTREGAELAANTPLYLALSSVAKAHAKVEENPEWTQLSRLLERCAQISTRVDQSRPLSADEQAFLNGLDRQLQALTGRDDAPIVMVLHRNYQDQKALQVALGKPKIATLRQARGARFHVQEFLAPVGKAMNNRDWRQRLQGVENQ